MSGAILIEQTCLSCVSPESIRIPTRANTMGAAESKDVDVHSGGPSVLLIDAVFKACLMQCQLEDVKPLFFLSSEITKKLTDNYKVI